MTDLKPFDVCVFLDEAKPAVPSKARAYTRDYNLDWKGAELFSVRAANGSIAKKLAIELAIRKYQAQQAGFLS